MPSYIDYETEIEEFCGRFFATVLLRVECDPGEPPVMYYKDGSGYPGSPAYVCPVEAKITTLSNAVWDRDRQELLKAFGPDLLAKLDEKALDWACKNVEDGDWLQDHLFEHLNSMSEDTRY